MPNDGIYKTSSSQERQHGPTAGNMGTLCVESAEIAFIKTYLSHGSCWN
jgi:hypothetical protein